MRPSRASPLLLLLGPAFTIPTLAQLLVDETRLQGVAGGPPAAPLDPLAVFTTPLQSAEEPRQRLAGAPLDAPPVFPPSGQLASDNRPALAGAIPEVPSIAQQPPLQSIPEPNQRLAGAPLEPPPVLPPNGQLANENRQALAGAPQNIPLNPLPLQPQVVTDAPTTTAAAVGPAAKPTSTSTTTKPYIGTEDAPVDGRDGKPHAGPFVDTTPDNEKNVKAGYFAASDNGLRTTTSVKAAPTSLEKFEANAKDGWKVSDIPEKNDGVMNDDNRPVPKKGTTGTTGGISEKGKQRLASSEERVPQEPKEAPPLPHSEEQHIDAAQAVKGNINGDKTQIAAAGAKDNKDPAAPKTAGDAAKKEDGYGENGYLMDKPADLPDKPHNIPHPTPDNKDSTLDDGPPFDASDRNKWLVNSLPDTEGRTGKSRPASDGSSSSSSSTPTAQIPSSASWQSWFHSFVLSLTMIIFSEIGDKTFLIAALMAMRHSRFLVFSAALAALIAMTVLSAVLGHAFPALLPRRLTTLAAAILFFVFGARSLREGLAMPKHAGIGEEMREVEAELEEKEITIQQQEQRRQSHSAHTLESGRSASSNKRNDDAPSSRSRNSNSSSFQETLNSALSGMSNLFSLVLSPAWVQTFIMTFLGEWGDRSQIATIAMAAGQDYWWVTLGAILGHACCTGLAVVGGRALAGRVSMRVVTIGGAVAFLVFGVIYLYEALFAGSA